MSTCRSCGAEVIFVPSSKTGRPMILDAKPEKRVIPVHVEDDLVLVPIDDPDVRARVLSVYVDHHVTCPDSASWKGKRREPANADR